MDESKPPGIRIGQIFLERASFKHRDDYLALPASSAAQVGDVTVTYESGMAEDETKGLLRIHVRTKPENKPIYEFDISMVALLQVDEEQRNMELSDYLITAGLTLLFPFVREAVANITMRGRFGPIWIHPMNIKVAVEAAMRPRSGHQEASAPGSTEAMG
jgi:preprotein translocase subunit SecB